eukprot:1158698-Pelagomonas_calceolata.AAC.3
MLLLKPVAKGVPKEHHGATCALVFCEPRTVTIPSFAGLSHSPTAGKLFRSLLPSTITWSGKWMSPLKTSVMGHPGLMRMDTFATKRADEGSCSARALSSCSRPAAPKHAHNSGHLEMLCLFWGEGALQDAVCDP